MKSTVRRLNVWLAIAVFLTGCATQPILTQEQVLEQNQAIKQLSNELAQARSNGAELLAPDGYSTASKLLARAMSEGSNRKTAVAEATATTGLTVVEKLNRDMEKSRDILEEVLKVRDRAYAAGARTLPDNRITDLDNELKTIAKLIENGDIERAKQRRPILLSNYSQIELTALKQGTVDQAKSAIAAAKRAGAEKYAPNTLLQAEEEMALATSILESDRTQTEKAEGHAQKAKWSAERSAAITELAKDFARRDYTMEEVILWHQQQLSSINQPLDGQLPFNEQSEKVVMSLKSAVSDLLTERDNLKAQLERTQSQSQAAEMKFSMMTREEQAEQRRFEQVQALFSPSEANVYRQGQNMIISAHGFQFPSGKSEIETNNFQLMNKIINAINKFPGARIDVTGHTDSVGTDAINQMLSEERANNVAKFITEVGGIEPERVTHRGFGESRPVASNETIEGRAENRRVEIKIINE